MANKPSTKNYNVTALHPDLCFERHVYHRDQFAHYLRWTHIMKEAKRDEVIVDFGCGGAPLLEVLYHNRYKQKAYYGLDIRQATIQKNEEKFKNVSWANFFCCDLVNGITPENPDGSLFDFSSLQGDKVCCFEVLEHIGKQNAHAFLENFKMCGSENAIYYLSTPNYDESVGAADNHTYDSGDGRGVAPQEFEHTELEDILHKHFRIVNKFGTFASIKDYKDDLNEWQTKMFEHLKEYYDTNLLAVLMAPFFPDKSRNTLWVLKRPNCCVG